MKPVVTTFRMALLGVAALALILSGCSVSDFLEWTDGPDTQSANPTQTTNGARSSVTPPATTPMPTATMWRYSTMTPTMTPTPFIDDMLPGTITPVPSSTVTPTPTPTPTSTPTPTRTPTPQPTPVVSLLPALPTEADLPDGLRLQREVAHLSIDDIAREAGDSAEYARLLKEWGFARGAAREFLLPNPGVVEFFTKVLGFDARVMEFDSASSASEAIAYQRETALSRPDWRLNDASAAQIADETVALSGTADYDGMEVRVAAIFVRDGDTVYRFVGVSGNYDAFNDVVDVARKVVERN